MARYFSMGASKSNIINYEKLFSSSQGEIKQPLKGGGLDKKKNV